jgi:hypothetical protein
MSRRLLAFRVGPTVELRLDDISLEVRDGRVLLALSDDVIWFSWEEWRDLVGRVEHSMQWIAANTPDDVTGTSFTIEPEPPR